MLRKQTPSEAATCGNVPPRPDSHQVAEACTEESCSALESKADSPRCPRSDTIGLEVDLITVKALLRPNALRRLDGQRYRFCPAPNCDVVYFDNAAGSVFRKEDLTVRVGQKETADPIPLCYCFDFTSSDIRRDLAVRGKTDIPVIISAEVEAGHCACEVKNPQGSCCLGNVAKAAKRLGAEILSPNK